MNLSEKQKAMMGAYGIPDYMHGALIRYYENGLPPGDFLTALLNNDLRETFARADDTNTYAVRGYVMWLYNEAPGGSWGYPNAVNDWTARFSEIEDKSEHMECPHCKEITLPSIGGECESCGHTTLF